MLKLPTIKNWSAFDSVGLYDLLALDQCIFKAMGKNLVLSQEMLPDLPTRASLVGLFHHKSMELVFDYETTSELEASIEAEIVKLQKIVDGWPHLKRTGSVSGWNEVNVSAAMAVRTFLEIQGAPRTDSQVNVEEKLKSRDKTLVGKPDFFLISGRTALLKELKSSDIRDTDGKIRDEYDKQVKFYSLLLYDNYAIDIVNVSLESSRGEFYQTTVTKAQVDETREWASKIINSANAIIAKAKALDQLTIVSGENCSTCKKRSLCGPFKQHQSSIELSYDSYLIEGRVENILGLQNKSAEVHISDLYSNSPKSLIIPAEAARELAVGKSYVFADLALQGSKTRWAEKSRIFQCD